MDPPVRWIRLTNEQSHTVSGALLDPTISRTYTSTEEHQDHANASGETGDRQSSGIIDAGYDREEGEVGQEGQGPQSSHNEKSGDKGVKPAWEFR